MFSRNTFASNSIHHLPSSNTMQKTPYCPIWLLILVFLGLSACKTRQIRHLQITDQLKQNGIVFRLQDYKQRIDYFEKKGMVERARTEQAEIEAYNRQLVKDFRNDFNFCEVRFFYASQIHDLRAGKRVLLNERLEPDPSAPLPPVVFIAGYGVDKVEEHAFSHDLFRIEQTDISIGPTFKTWRKGDKMQARDVRKVNQKLKDWNTPK